MACPALENRAGQKPRRQGRSPGPTKRYVSGRYKIHRVRLFPFTLALAALAFADPSPDKSCGPKNASLVIDIYSDFECPACKKFHDETLPDVIKFYADTGKAQIIYHDFPLPMHKYSRDAARWANAAAHVHKYKQVGDAFFRTQNQWSVSGDVRSVVAGVLTPSEMKTVEGLMRDPGFDDGIAKDVALGTQAGLRQTPTIVVTHKQQPYPFGGFISYTIFKQALDDIARR